jgi:hypothetical protein
MKGELCCFMLTPLLPLSLKLLHHITKVLTPLSLRKRQASSKLAFLPKFDQGKPRASSLYTISLYSTYIMLMILHLGCRSLMKP